MKRTFDIRVLDAGDAVALRDMLSMLGTAFDEPAVYTERQPDDAYLRSLLASDTFIAVAAVATSRRSLSTRSWASAKRCCTSTSPRVAAPPTGDACSRRTRPNILRTCPCRPRR